MSGRRVRIRLQEDDCAPDARVYFNKRFKEIVGVGVDDFMKKAFFARFSTGFVWRYRRFILSVWAEHPYYTLEESAPARRVKASVLRLPRKQE